MKDVTSIDSSSSPIFRVAINSHHRKSPSQILRQQLDLRALGSIDALVGDGIPPTERSIPISRPARQPAAEPIILPPELTVGSVHGSATDLVADEDG
jgi:hypothetical protein